jgi:hypothetical protein
MDDTFMFHLDNGRSIAVRALPDYETGFVSCRVDGRRAGGTYLLCADVMPSSSRDEIDEPTSYTSVRIEFRIPAEGAQPETRHDLPHVNGIAFWGSLTWDLRAEAERMARNTLGPWPYIRRANRDYLPAGAAKAARAVCLALIEHFLTRDDLPALTHARLRNVAVDRLDLIGRQLDEERLLARQYAERAEVSVSRQHVWEAILHHDGRAAT